MNRNELQLVSFEQGKRLKAAGFDWPTNHFYGHTGNDFCLADNYQNWNSTKWECDKRISAPTVALALQWFRDEKGIDCAVCFITPMMQPKIVLYYGAYKEKESTEVKITGNRDYPIYKDAENDLLDELLTLIEK